jgi:hypothetical protein
MSGRYILLLGFLVSISTFSLLYGTRQRSEATGLASSRDQLRKSLADAQAQIQSLSSRLTRAEAAAAAAEEPVPAVHAFPPRTIRRPPAPRPAVRPKPVEDPRWRRVESKLAEHQSQLDKQSERIDATQNNIERTGDELDGKINSTKNELNRSIATTHDDVVLLQKRGESNIYEFNLSKSKQFQRVGPLSLSLRRVDAKHRNYDLTVMVGDVNVDKKHVNLFEPVWIGESDRPHPIQVVVNQIDKNQVRGYISEPRYKSTELAGPSAPSNPQTQGLKTR